MNRNLVLLGICLLAVSFVGETFGQKKKPRIGIAGIQIENSVFVPNRQPLVGHVCGKNIGDDQGQYAI